MPICANVFCINRLGSSSHPRQVLRSELYPQLVSFRLAYVQCRLGRKMLGFLGPGTICASVAHVAVCLDDVVCLTTSLCSVCVLPLQQAYPEAEEIRALARRYGPELAKSITLLIDENKSLRLKLQASIRAQARLQGTATTLGNALRDHEERAYARELTSSGRSDSQTKDDRVRYLTATTHGIQMGGQSGSVDRQGPQSVGNFVSRYCACSQKLQEILDCIDSQMGDYERGVWQTHINVLEEERDSLMLK